MKKLKRLFSLSLAILMAFIMTTAVFASDINYQLDIEEQIKSIVSNYEDYEVVDLADVEGSVNPDDFIKVTSLEELDQFLNDMKKASQEVTNVTISQDDLTSNSRVWGSVRKSEWAPLYLYGLGAPLTVWKYVNVVFQYDYNPINSKIFTNVDKSDITSDITGVFIGNGWTQTGAYANITNSGYGMDVTIDGYGYIGFDIEGFPTAIRIPDTWTFHFSYTDI